MKRIKAALFYSPTANLVISEDVSSMGLLDQSSLIERSKQELLNNLKAELIRYAIHMTEDNVHFTIDEK